MTICRFRYPIPATETPKQVLPSRYVIILLNLIIPVPVDLISPHFKRNENNNSYLINIKCGIKILPVFVGIFHGKEKQNHRNVLRLDIRCGKENIITHFSKTTLYLICFTNISQTSTDRFNFFQLFCRRQPKTKKKVILPTDSPSSQKRSPLAFPDLSRVIINCIGFLRL